MIERYIAIDNVCAWPNLSVLRDGTIVATIFNQPHHAGWEGHPECWASTDGGATWRLRGSPAINDPTTNRMNVGAGTADNGDLIVITSGWSDRARPGAKAPPLGRVLEPWLCRSADGGKTWSVTKTGVIPAAPDGLCPLVPFGDITPGNDGRLRAGFYSFSLTDKIDGRPQGYNYLLTSDDDGRTWKEPAVICGRNHVEAAVLHVGGGRWLAVSRVFGTLALEVYRSDDDGRTWRFVADTGVLQLSAAHLLKLADGRVLLAYGNRNATGRGIAFRLSDDDGLSWRPPRQLINLPDHVDLGYPACVQRPDGRILTAYYASSSHEHHRYHMGIAICDVDDLNP